MSGLAPESDLAYIAGMKKLSFALIGSLFILSLASFAQAGDKPAADKKPAATEAAAPAGKETVLTGTFGCAKCSFKEAKACGNVLKVKDGEKVTTYQIADNAVSKEHHEDICHAEAGKPATVTGTVSHKGKKNILTASAIKLD